MNIMVRSRNSSDALALADAALGEGRTRSGEPARARLRAILDLAGRILDALPEDACGDRRRDEALQAAALAACVPEGAAPDGQALVAGGYAPGVVEATIRLVQAQAPGRLTLVQDSDDLARSGDVGLIAVRYAALTHDSRIDLVMALPAGDRGVLGVYHKSRKALAAGFLDLTGVDVRSVGEDVAAIDAGAGGPSLDEARAAVDRGLAGMPALAPARALLDAIAAAPRTLTLAEALSAMGRTEPDADAMAALAFLSQGDKAALDVGVVFVDERGVAHALPAGASARIASEGYAHPVTGEPVPDPEGHLYLRISPRPGLVPESPQAADEASVTAVEAATAGPSPDAAGPDAPTDAPGT